MTNPLKGWELINVASVKKSDVVPATMSAFKYIDTIFHDKRIKDVQVVEEWTHEDFVGLGIYVKYYEQENEMSKEDELRQELQEAQDALERAQKKLKEFEENNVKKYGWWKPEHNDGYYYIDSDGCVKHDTHNNVEIDHMRVEDLNCFKTRKEAELERLKIVINRQIQDIALRLNKGKKINWSNYHQIKYFIAIIEMDNGTCQVEQGTVVTNGRIDKAYCLDMHFADVVEKELKEDLKQYSKLKQQIEEK